MYQIYPVLQPAFSRCPDCGCQLSGPDSLFFYSKITLAAISCTCCDNSYYHSYPCKDKSDPNCMGITRNGKKNYFSSADYKSFTKEFAKKTHAKVNGTFEVVRIKESYEPLLVNFLYQHKKVLKKALPELRKLIAEGSEMIVLVPERYKMLIPEGCSEFWIVNTTHNHPAHEVVDLNEFVNEQLKRFRKVYLTELIPGDFLKKGLLQRFLR